MRVVFFGTPDFAVPALSALHIKHEVLGVFTRMPTREGLSPVHQCACALHLPVYHLKTHRDVFFNLSIDMAILAAYGVIIPQDMLDHPAYGFLNIHPSKLPKYRGASPIQSALLAGDHQTAISIMQMDAGCDTGPVLRQVDYTIGENERYGELSRRLSQEGARLLLEVMEVYPALQARPQGENGVSETFKIKKTDGNIQWTHAATSIVHAMRAYDPWPMLHTRHRGDLYFVHDGHALAMHAKEPPGFVAGYNPGLGLDVATGEGYFRITRIQKSSKKTLFIDDFMRGSSIRVGDVLGS